MTDKELPTPTFMVVVHQLATMALIELGEIANPATGEKSVSKTRARFSIDVLGELRKKVEGNLTDDEARTFDSILAELSRRFVAAS